MTDFQRDFFLKTNKKGHWPHPLSRTQTGKLRCRNPSLEVFMLYKKYVNTLYTLSLFCWDQPPLLPCWINNSSQLTHICLFLFSICFQWALWPWFKWTPIIYSLLTSYCTVHLHLLGLSDFQLCPQIRNLICNWYIIYSNMWGWRSHCALCTFFSLCLFTQVIVVLCLRLTDYTKQMTNQTNAGW